MNVQYKVFTPDGEVHCMGSNVPPPSNNEYAWLKQIVDSDVYWLTTEKIHGYISWRNSTPPPQILLLDVVT